MLRIASAEGFVGPTVIVLVAGGPRDGGGDETGLGSERASGVLLADAVAADEGGCVVEGDLWWEGLEIGC